MGALANTIASQKEVVEKYDLEAVKSVELVAGKMPDTCDWRAV